MVSDTRATPCPGGIRPLDAPQPVQVEMDEDDIPVRVLVRLGSTSLSRVQSRGSPRGEEPLTLSSSKGRPALVEGSPYFESSETGGLRAGLSKGRWHEVLEVQDIWRIEDEWWRKTPIVRLYYQVATEDGRRIIIFRDLVDGVWYRQGS